MTPERVNLEDPIETVESLVQKGEITTALTFEYITIGDGYVTVQTNLLIAPTKPAESIGELNQVLAKLPKPDYPEKEDEQPAKFSIETGTTILPSVSYYQNNLGQVSDHGTPNTAHPIPAETLQSIISRFINFPTMKIHRTVNITIYPTAEISQAVAINQHRVLTERNSRLRQPGNLYTITKFDPTLPTTDLSPYSDKEIYYMDFSIPQSLWNPTEATS